MPCAAAAAANCFNGDITGSRVSCPHRCWLSQLLTVGEYLTCTLKCAVSFLSGRLSADMPQGIKEDNGGKEGNLYIYTHTTPQREKERAGSELASER